MTFSIELFFWLSRRASGYLGEKTFNGQLLRHTLFTKYDVINTINKLDIAWPPKNVTNLDIEIAKVGHKTSIFLDMNHQEYAPRANLTVSFRHFLNGGEFPSVIKTFYRKGIDQTMTVTGINHVY